MGYLARKTNLYPFVLLFFALLPNSEQTLFNSGNSWVALFIKTLLGWVYLSSFLNKMRNSRKDWFNGSKIQNTIIYHLALEGKLNKNPMLTKGISWIVLIFESLFWTCIFSSQYDLLFISIALIFHLILYFILGINFLKYYLPVFVTLIFS
jgi:hypothetical protein